MRSKMFIVGNGSSLKQTNLDLLKGKPSMAVNKIHLIYPFTQWRPTHYVKVDFSAFDGGDWKGEILNHVMVGEECLLWDAFRSGAEEGDGNREYIFEGIGNFSNVTYIPRCRHHYLRTAAWHEVCTGLNSVVTMIIWAWQMGYEEIVLVGCDGHFTRPDEDHFTPAYYQKVDGDYANRNNFNIGLAHDLLFATCPIPIYDATVDGHLTQYPKVKLEEMV